MTNKHIEALEKIKEAIKKHKDCKHRQFCKSTLRGKWIDCMLGKGLRCNPNFPYCKYEKHIPKLATKAITPQECDVNVTECKFYNDHDANVAECNEVLDERYLPVHTCEERKDCTFRKYNNCKFFQNGYCGEFCASDGEEYYFGNGLQKCSDNPNCYYKQQYKLGKAYNELFEKYINEGADFELKIKNLKAQLHSQEKTFTVEEIKEIILSWDGVMTDDLVEKFEKAVG